MGGAAGCCRGNSNKVATVGEEVSCYWGNSKKVAGTSSGVATVG